MKDGGGGIYIFLLAGPGGFLNFTFNAPEELESQL